MRRPARSKRSTGVVAPPARARVRLPRLGLGKAARSDGPAASCESFTMNAASSGTWLGGVSAEFSIEPE